MTNNSGSKKRVYDLQERTARFAESVIDFVRTLERNEINRPLVSQIIRSSSSIGANYMEADGAESKKDFYHKVAICRKESKETIHWARVLLKANPTKEFDCHHLSQEAKELSLIFSAIIRSKLSI